MSRLPDSPEVDFDVVVVIAEGEGLSSLLVAVSHLPAGRPPLLLSGVEKADGLAVEVVQDGLSLERGGVYLLPSQAALKVNPDRRLKVLPAAESTLDTALSSLAGLYGAGVLVAVLDGEGLDGVAGLRAVRAAGGTVLAQRPSENAVQNLPRLVIEAAEADLVVTPRFLGRTLADLLTPALTPAAGQERNDLLQAVLDSSSEDVQLFRAVRDEGGRIVDFEWLLTNRWWNMRWGEMQGRRLLTQNPGVLETGLFDKFVRVTETGVPIQHEQFYRHEQFDGWFRQTLVKVQDGFLASTLDITESRKAVNLWQASEENYRALFESIDEGFCTIELRFDAEGRAVDYRMLSMNPAYRQQTGLTDVTGRWVSEFLPGLEPFWFEVYGQVARSGEARRFEHRATALGRDYDVYAFRVGEARNQRVGVLFNDITGRKHAEEALRESAERFRAVANIVPDFLWESEPDGSTNWYNARWLEYTGQTFEQATGWGWLEVIHPDDRQGSGERYREAVRSGRAFSQEHRIRRWDGEYRWFAVNAAPLKDEQGRVVRMYGAATDIHDLHQMNTLLEERVEERTRRLADLNAELGSVITRTAHNLALPADYLSQFLELASVTDPQGGLPPHDPALLQDEVTRLRGVAQDLRELSRLERHHLNLELIPLRELFQEIQAETTAHGAEWIIKPLPIVRGDRALLRQALDVLLTFTLSSTRGTRFITVDSRDVEGEVHLCVEDDGAGLSPEEASTLFDLAVRTDQGIPLLEGSGLAQVRRVLARHGGWAWAESRLNGGKVVMAFPRDEEVSGLERLLGS